MMVISQRHRPIHFTGLNKGIYALVHQFRSFSQGNFNYDGNGNVDFQDWVVLAQRNNVSLANEGTLTSGAALPGKLTRADFTRRSDERVAAEMLASM